MAGAPISTTALQHLQNIKHNLWQYRQRKESTFIDIGTYINTEMGDWNRNSDPLANQLSPETGKNRYDTTGESASNLAANGIEGYGFGRNHAWFRLAFEN